MKSNDHDPLFSGRVPAHVTPSLAPHELVPESPEDRFAPGSPERRARLQRYVKLTVAACALLCVAAVVRVGVARVSASSETEESATALARPSAPTLSAAPTEAPPAVVAAAAPAPAPSAAPSATAIEERELARRWLEQGKTRDAIAAAERATAADPTDAESWLLLGSANQELGRTGAARAAFRSCLKSAKRGPLRECRAMLR